MANTANRDAFYSWYAQYLKDRGLQFTKSGSKSTYNDKHAIDPNTGYWIDPSYSGSKPIRWLLAIDPFSSPVKASVPNEHRAERLGHANTAQGDKAGIAIRVIPVFAVGGGQFDAKDDWEVTLLFSFADAVPVGGAAETFDLDTTSGEITYLAKPQPYIFAALLSMVPRTDTVTFGSTNVSYGDVIDAISALITCHPVAGVSGKVPVYDLTKDTELARLQKDVEAAYSSAPPPVVKKMAAAAADGDEEGSSGGSDEISEVPENKSLLGIDPSVYRQINAALKSGKRHLMFYGPPGTGKTALARYVAEFLSPGKWTLVTGSADWSSQDIIGGYQPIGGGDVAFQAGVLLREFHQPLIIDEMNRCDIDKVLGPLFTVLSGQHTTLPYRVDIKDKSSPQFVILAVEKATPAAHEFAPGSAWRLISTINSIDKASLYQMSYALSRRFGWIYVDVPKDLRSFIADYLARETGKAVSAAPEKVCPMASLWSTVNEVRPIGPAPIIDAIAAIRSQWPDADFFEEATSDLREATLDSIDMVVLPMLDGILPQDAAKIADAAISALKLDGQQSERIRTRLASLAV